MPGPWPAVSRRLNQPGTSQPAPARPVFVQRSGQRLTLAGSPYRFVGFDMWKSAVASWNEPAAGAYNLNTGTRLAGALAGINNSGAYRMNAIRFWCFQQFTLDSTGVTPVPAGTPTRWDAIDKVLAVCDDAGFKVIACLADSQGGDTGQGVLGPAWYSGGYTSTVLDYDLAPYRTWVQNVVTRYQADPRILAWELVNEPDPSGGGTCLPGYSATFLSFVTDIAGLVKGIDPNHLVSIGQAGEICAQDGSDYSTLNALSTVDLCSFHDYTGAANTGGTWAGGNGLDNISSRAATLNKPVYVGECGIHLNTSPVSGDPNARATYLGAKLSAQFGGYANLAGYLPWQFDPRGPAGASDDYVYGPADPALPVLNGYTL